MFIADFVRRGKVYQYPAKIGTVDFSKSTWYEGASERFYHGKGAFYAACYPLTKHIRLLYFVLRTRRSGALSLQAKLRWMWRGMKAYKDLESYNDQGRYIDENNSHLRR